MFPLLLTGCNEPVHSPDEIDTLYSSLKTDKVTSQFFNGETIVVNFDATKVDINNTRDKSYIFNKVYRYYLASSSRLFSEVMKRVTNPSFVIRNFSEKEVTNIYNSLQDVKNKLYKFAESKTIYEQSEGNLYYKDTLNDYNNLISSLYNFNTTFANAYFFGVGKVDFSQSNLTDSNIRDMLSYQLMIVSKVSFNYELVSFKLSNPLGEIMTWYNSTTQLNDFITLANMCLNKLDSNNDLTPNGANAVTITTLFTNIQNNAEKYNFECNKFDKALENFDVKAYFASSNKEVYLENCTALEKSSFNIMQYFLNGRYSAFTKCLTEVVIEL